MKIIQVIDLDGTTVKVDETNPSEPKIVAALQFDVATRKAVPIAEVAELIFAKPLNANVEAVCIGYKGADGKYYGKFNGLEESMFEPKAQPAPQPPVTEENRGFIELTIPSDYAAPPELRIRPQDGKGESNYSLNELYRGADLNNGIYAIIGNDLDVYHFSHASFDGEGVHTLRADKVYREPLASTMRVMFGTTPDDLSRLAMLNKEAAQLDGLSYAGGKFRLDANGADHIERSLETIDRL